MGQKELVGTEIKNYRMRSGLKIKDLAALMEVSSPYISMVENAKGNLPTKSFLRKFSDVISKQDSKLSPESIYISLCVVAGYPIDESIVDDHGEDVFYANERRGYIESLGNKEYRTLEKPYYDLFWLLDQPESGVFFNIQQTSKSNIDSQNSSFKLDHDDREFIKSTIADYLKHKSNFISSFPLKVHFVTLEEDSIPTLMESDEVIDEDGNTIEYVSNITGSVIIEVNLKYFMSEIAFNLRVEYDFDIDFDKEITNTNLYIDSQETEKLESLKIEKPYYDFFVNELGEYLNAFALDNFQEEVEVSDSSFIKVHIK
ncbi:transcriptional regulator with XRE-family HTH domain [Alkalibacillus filiformis]|uniref:Transcriptional regulator with XRE-family HTH domain n=1 Tax=Alkalibacillus filiformis TaxID=200990 RepID=A0ABU0DVY9_9BACI|nr:helix-turn-helix transcriptional regulator [Alkalibacillus filiformis]MDQ0352468.1 transcriptional regulator with XRE-family HTH domain [Alkalibacillus filiformis]